MKIADKIYLYALAILFVIFVAIQFGVANG